MSSWMFCSKAVFNKKKILIRSNIGFHYAWSGVTKGNNIFKDNK